MPAPSRYPSGLTTRKKTDPFGQYTHPDRTDQHEYWDDFDRFTAAQFTTTVVGASTPALIAGDHGLLGITTSALASDSVAMQKTPESFLIEVGKQAWFGAGIRVSSLACVVVMGLQVVDTTPEDVTDGIYWLSTAGTGALTGIVRRNAATGSSSTPSGALVANTFSDLAWYYDGKDTVNFYVNRVLVSSITGVAASFLPDTLLTVSFGVRTTAAASVTMAVDYLFAAKDKRNV